MEARQLLDLEARRQADMKERLRAQREHAARTEAERIQKERKRAAVADANEKERRRDQEIKREALRLQDEKEARQAQTRAEQDLQEDDQDKRIKALARARYEERQLEWMQQEREQDAKNERDMAQRRERRDAQRRQAPRKISNQELPAASPGTGQNGAGILSNVGAFRRRESDGSLSLPRRQTSAEAFTRVFSQRRREPPPPRPKVTLGTSYEEVTAGEAPTPVERITKDEMPRMVRAGGEGVVPGTDAPISAVNAGERRVLVQCGKSFINLPITPSTTPVDLIFSAANCLTENIEPSKSVLLEHFGKAGIQRPLRRYEHVRDVMNSWDDDKQNSLHIIPSATAGNDVELDSTFVPAGEPDDSSFYMYYSQKPGKWEKRYITLRTDGQVIQSKKPKTKDFSKICHMSDFDVYTPMPVALSKKINPPKRYCFGIKSQQKSAMFMATEDFVHFFCTNSQYDAAAFYKATQGWRSWYLVHIMGEGQKSRLQPTNAGVVDTQTALNTPDNRNNHYQLGSFKPIDFGGIFGNAQQPQQSSDMPIQSRYVKNRSSSSGKAPSSYRQSSSGHGASHSARSSQDQDPSTFAPSGLLGRSYSIRQAEVQAKSSDSQNEGPFISGPSLMSEIDSALGNTNTAMRRQSSRHSATQKPLLDFSSEHLNLPQDAKHGKGFHPQNVGSGGLIESATGPDPAPNDTMLGRGKSVRGTGLHWHKRHSQTSTEESPFLANGLLANLGHSQGGVRTGRGVMQGSDAQGPMLDMREKSQFAQGSLLEQAEQEKRFGTNAPVIDRRKGREVTVGTGEGL